MAMLFAATYPERTRALVLYGGYAQLPQMGARARGGRALRRRGRAQLGHRRDAQGFRARAGSRDPHFSAWWARFERLSCSPTAAIALARMNAAIDLRGILPSIHVPTLVLHRAEDARGRPRGGALPRPAHPRRALRGAARAATIRSGPATSTRRSTRSRSS